MTDFLFLVIRVDHNQNNNILIITFSYHDLVQNLDLDHQHHSNGILSMLRLVLVDLDLH